MSFYKKIMVWFLDKLTPGCEVITEKISQSLDKKLSFKEKLQIKIHLFYCEFCLRYQKQILAMRKLVQKSDALLEEITLNHAQKERLKKNLKKKLES